MISLSKFKRMSLLIIFLLVVSFIVLCVGESMGWGWFLCVLLGLVRVGFG